MPRIFSELLAELLVLQHEIADSHGHTVGLLQEEIRKLQAKDNGRSSVNRQSQSRGSTKRLSSSITADIFRKRPSASEHRRSLGVVPSAAAKIAPAGSLDANKELAVRHVLSDSAGPPKALPESAVRHVHSASAVRHVRSVCSVDSVGPPQPLTEEMPSVPTEQTPVLVLGESTVEVKSSVEEGKRKCLIDEIEDIPLPATPGSKPAAPIQVYSSEVSKRSLCLSADKILPDSLSQEAPPPKEGPQPAPPRKTGTMTSQIEAQLNKSPSLLNAQLNKQYTTNSLSVQNLNGDALRRVSDYSQVSGANSKSLAPMNSDRASAMADHKTSASYTPGDINCGAMMINGLDALSELVAYPIWERINTTMDHAKSQHGNKHVSHRMTIIEQLRKKAKSVDFHKVERSGTMSSKLSRVLVRHPVSPERLLWLAIGLLLICMDMVVVPMEPFALPELEQCMRVTSWIMAPYWTIDFAMSFFVGYQHRGTFEMRLRRTAWRYVTTWMPIDLALVLIDWAAIIATEANAKKGASAARVTRSLRALRALRSLRLARAVKLPTIMKEASMFISRSEVTSICFTLIKLMCSILLINHVIACLWFGVGNNDNGWVAVYKDLQSNHSWQNMYLTALHWSLTQFTPATMSVQPENVNERLFAVSVLIFALLTFSSFVSSITNMMTHLRSMKAEEEKQFLKLEHYLHDKHISYYLSLRVRRYLEHYLVEQKHGLEERDVKILGALSEPLRLEIHYEVYSPWLRRHPFFFHYQSLNLPSMQKLCHHAVVNIHLSMDDVLFSPGEIARSMSMCCTGKFQYAHSSLDGVESATQLHQGQWCCEIVLWAPWQHRGQLRSSAESSIFCLEAEVFHNVVLGSQAALFETSSYAVEAVRTLSEYFEFQDMSDILKSPFDPHQLCIHAFKHLKRTRGEGFKWMKAITKNMGGEAAAPRRKLSTENIIRTSWLSTASSTDSEAADDEEYEN